MLVNALDHTEKVILVGHGQDFSENKKILSTLMPQSTIYSVANAASFMQSATFICIVSSPICALGKAIEKNRDLNAVVTTWQKELEDFIKFLRKKRRNCKVLCLEQILQNNPETTKYLPTPLEVRQAGKWSLGQVLFMQIAGNLIAKESAILEILDELDASLSGGRFIQSTDPQIMTAAFDCSANLGRDHEKELDILQDIINQLTANGDMIINDLKHTQKVKASLDAKVRKLEQQLVQRTGDVYYFQTMLQETHKSLSWRIMAPLRKIRRILK